MGKVSQAMSRNIPNRKVTDYGERPRHNTEQPTLTPPSECTRYFVWDLSPDDPKRQHIEQMMALGPYKKNIRTLAPQKRKRL